MEETNPIVPSPQSNINSGRNATGSNPRMAGFFERLIALIIDAIIVGVVTIPAGILLGAANFDSDSTGVYFSSAVSIIVTFAYFGYFYTTRGQSIGKMVMKMKVVKSSNLEYLSWGDTFMREVLGKFVSGLLLNLGYLWYFMNEKRQTWHDSIASTYVVKTDDKGVLLMDGPSTYPKEPVKTFGCCALIGLLVAGLIGLMVYAFAAFLGSLESTGIDISDNFDQNFQYEGDEMMPPVSEEELRRYMEENFSDEYETWPQPETEMENTPQDETQTL